MIEITVKTLDSQNHPFSIDEEITIKDLKDIIAEKVSISAETQRLIYCGHVLKDEKKVKDYDVNGKVIHLVQRAPPQPNRPSPPPSASRRQGRHGNFIAIPPTSNSIYLGSMAYADDMNSQALPQLPLNQNLSNSRLNVARRMLRLVNAILDHLESHTADQNTPRTTLENLMSEDRVETLPILAAQVFVPTFPNLYGGVPSNVEQATNIISGSLPAALSSVSSSLRNMMNGQNNNVVLTSDSFPTMEQLVAAATAAESTARLSSAAASSSSSSPSSSAGASAAASSTAPPSEPPAAATSEGETASAAAAAAAAADAATTNTPLIPPNSGNSATSSIARTQSMFELISELNRTQLRFQPFLDRYNDMMRSDPIFESEDDLNQAQFLFDNVSAVMHAFGHAYHALSDILCPLERPAPRSLLCRPTLVHHAVLQAGISLPVRFQEPAESESPRDPAETTSEASVQTSTEAAPPTEEATVSGQTSSAGENAERSAAPNQPASTESSQGNQEVPTDQAENRARSAAFIDFSDVVPQIAMNQLRNDQNVDFVVAMSADPDSNSAEGGNRHMDTNFLQGLVNSVTNSVIRSVNLMESRASEAQRTSTTVQGTNSEGTQGQNSQARGNTATLPTTSTQTPRATPRPHVQLSAQSFRGFDPFLQCNSHHIHGFRAPSSRQGSTVIGSRQEAAEIPSVQLRVRSASLPRHLHRMRGDRMPPRSTVPTSNVTAGSHTHNIRPTDNRSASVIRHTIPTVATVVTPSTTDVDEEFYDAHEQISHGEMSRGRVINESISLPAPSSEITPPTLPAVAIGSEQWHNNVPADWVSVVTRDVDVQRQQPAQAPYSDAYLSSVPAKRRKVISCNKPQGTLPQVISDGLRQAVIATGLTQVAPIEIVAGAAGGDPTIQAAYREELRESVRTRPSHASAPELAPLKRFPNASVFFKKP